MLEAALHGDNTFLTLTYNEKHLPKDLSVCPREISLFMKRLRKTTRLSLRYFAVGEYGDTNGLPHYHLALFGLPCCAYGQTRTFKDPGRHCCSQCTLIASIWGKGFAFLGTLTSQSAQYTAGYVTKKMTKHSDPRLEGRLPEFARMSLRPGIGYNMMHEVASTLMEHNLERNLLDVPTVLTHGRSNLPLGRYLRRSLRKLIGRSPDAPHAALEIQKAKLHPLRKAAFDSSSSFAQAVLHASLGKRIQIEAKAKRSHKVKAL